MIGDEPEAPYGTLSTLDCCKDKNCPVCGGRGYIAPRKESLTQRCVIIKKLNTKAEPSEEEENNVSRRK